MGRIYPFTKGRDQMTIGERDISALRECIMGNSNFSDVEKEMLIDAITVALFRFEQKERLLN